ncbi:chromosome partitioning protein, ParB family [Robiginitalea myxolifaciens]|uniref:Chromosome partitioning protein, ParB family n=1 Tax=Robiginitalea myxolifaciens TaxID=400055 RepID=A0A1I6FNB5_9FLAO|nr:ParB/RepB/Spo0J family partition protein [Robiginitalea myxolifaciens]SFR31412.1 chromosome partitioning protein, ParB family [Robiginitalea myxolifaciens]
MAKATKKQALGRGLSALLNDPDNDIKSASDRNADQVVGSIVELDLERIEVNPYQPRTNFSEEALEELATSIKELGLIQPITVRKMDFNRYQLVSGERRFRASQRIGLKTIPAYIRLANDQETLEMALVENIQRQDLDPVEIALSYQRLIDEIGLTQERLSDRVGKKRSTITNYLRLLKLDPILQTGMRDGFISMGHGRALVNVENRDKQLSIYEKILADGLSVRQTESLVRESREGAPQTQGSPSATKTAVRLPGYATQGQEELKAFLQAAVKVQAKGSKGKITVPFSSEDEFRRILKRITGV